MKNWKFFISLIFIIALSSVMFMTGCGDTNYLDSDEKVLRPGIVLDDDDGNGDTCIGDECDDDETPIPGGDLHAIFSQELGTPISRSYMGAIDPDPTGLTACNDYDGDGIPNSDEIISNPFVADYPRIVTRISAPITLEIRVSDTLLEKNHSETLTENNLKETLQNSMEDKHYTSAQEKTTPYVTKESLSEEGKNASSYGYSTSSSSKDAFNFGTEIGYDKFKFAFNYGQDKERSESNSENTSIENQFGRSTMSEKTVFEDVNYIDNVDRNGVEFTSDTIQDMVQSYRKSTALDNTTEIGPDDGYVRASLFIKNMTVNMPVRITNLKCTLSFRTPSGKFLPVRTFYLLNEDYSRFEESIYGGEEMGPFVIEIRDLNTNEVKKALANGYVPQIHVVSYEMDRVDDSNYNPGVDNLKIVEETAKARTATIKIVGSGIRELHRVAAFDIEKTDDNDNPYENLIVERQVSPGISLKKALFNILRDQVGDGEQWEEDADGSSLTVADSDLKWKPGATDHNEYIYGENTNGNKWNRFETYVKSYVDERNQLKRMETIKSIDGLSKYNPFSKEDNENYNSNELLSLEEVRKMKFWVIFHDGRYYDGDINDPIWAGERYEIVCMDMLDFNEHFESYSYTPFQSGERVYFSTRWNSLTEEPGEYARAVYMGKVFSNDVIKLEIDLLESRFLFDRNSFASAFGDPEEVNGSNIYYNFNYTFEQETKALGIPDDFTYSVYGGTNSLWVYINEAEKAVKYDITFYPTSIDPEDNPDSVKTVTVRSEDVAARNGNVIICSQTPDEIDSDTGEVTSYVEYTELEGSEDGIEYLVTVKAVGLYPIDETNTMDVSRKGTSSNNIARVYQPLETDSARFPGAFGFGATGRTDAIDVRITESTNAEYYTVRFTGPYNYGGSSTVKEVTAFTGYNNISFEEDRPSFADLEAKDFTPGLYAVEVFAKNRYSTGDGQESTMDTVYVEVQYDRYRQQRRFAPRISSDLFNLTAIDLEVNFDDGSGWFKLQPYDPYETGMTQGDDESRIIDCYYNSYMENNKQKFYIRFMAPDEDDIGLPNVFFGGRVQTDLYIRTIPKTKFRDTFWMTPGLDADGNIIEYSESSLAARYLSFAFLTGYDDVTDYWLGDNTDATEIEDSVASLYSSGESSTADPDDYFFSPREERLYAIRGTLSDTDQLQPNYRPDPPGFDARVIDQYEIYLENISGSRLTNFELYYCEGVVDTDSIIADAEADATGASWIDDVSGSGWAHTALDAYTDTYPITGLDPGTTYTFLLSARNKYGISVPTPVQVTTKELPPELAGTPEIGEDGASDDYDNVVVDSDSITIYNLSAENVDTSEGHYFIAYWKDSSNQSTDVDSGSWQSVQNNGDLEIPVGDGEWDVFTVRIYSHNLTARSVGYKQLTIDPPTVLMETDAYNAYYGYGTFKTNPYNLIDIAGIPLTYDSDLISLFDSGISGGFNSGSCMRIVVNEQNAFSGLGLTPVAVNLTAYSGDTAVSPPSDQLYIDPVAGSFVLPRPIYWSRCESLNNILTDYEIGDSEGSELTATIAGSYFFVDGKFGKCLRHNWGTDHVTNVTVFPFRQNFHSPDKITVSCWIRGENASRPWWKIVLNSVTINLCGPVLDYSSIVINDQTIVTNTQILPLNNWHHVYIIMDKDGTKLGVNGNTIEVYINGVIYLSTNESLTSYDAYNNLYFFLHDPTTKYCPYVLIDNIKIWDHVVSTSPSWEYNNGTGREDAMHMIYGSANGYTPNLTGGNNGVGYYYMDQN